MNKDQRPEPLDFFIWTVEVSPNPLASDTSSLILDLLCKDLKLQFFVVWDSTWKSERLCVKSVGMGSLKLMDTVTFLIDCLFKYLIVIQWYLVFSLFVIFNFFDYWINEIWLLCNFFPTLFVKITELVFC